MAARSRYYMVCSFPYFPDTDRNLNRGVSLKMTLKVADEIDGRVQTVPGIKLATRDSIKAGKRGILDGR